VEIATAVEFGVYGPKGTWRIVDPLLTAGAPVYEYEPNTWGPREVDQKVSPAGGWRNPIVANAEADH
jgi:glucose-6-phosphate 1-dehydrogenase